MKKIIIGNWKMNPLSEKDAKKWFKNIVQSLGRIKNTQVVICAPHIFLKELARVSKKVSLGAQDAFWGEVGPYTGEISAEMIYELGARYVILGHSERRNLGEVNALINKKVKGALAAGLIPILCVGESERDEKHSYYNVVKEQLEECLKGVSKDSISKIVVAYEPVWAISSTLNRRDATAEDSKEMTIYIRKILSNIANPEVAKKTRVIYGGSVNEKDVGEFLEHGGVDGALPGKASLDPKKFAEIVKICEASKN